jgi:hypothetical protein
MNGALTDFEIGAECRDAGASTGLSKRIEQFKGFR